MKYIDKWILTNIYDNYIHDLPPNHLLYNELYNEDEYIYIEDNEIFMKSLDTTTLI